jgi:hypothetical protein
MENREHDKPDELWELLGKARGSKVSPYFARNVVRAVREGEGARNRFAGIEALAGWLSLRRVPLGLAAMLVALIGFVAYQGGTRPVPGGGGAETVAGSASGAALDTAGDFEIVADLDFLVAYEETATWLGDDIY